MRRLFVFAVCCLMLVGAAHAQSTSTFEPAATGTDLAAGLLDVVVGRIDGASTSVSALASAIRVLNLAALGFGTLMFSYFVVVGTLRTAEDGELLGRKWSSMWIPARFVAVTALMVPGASGYSAGQAAVIWLAKAGSTAATTTWVSAAEYIVGGSDRMAAQFNSPAYAASLDAAMRTVWRATACTAGFQRRSGLTGAQFGLGVTQLPDASYRIEWGSRGSGTDLTPAQCGSITTAAPAPVKTAQDAVIDSIDGVSLGTMSVDTTPAYNAAASKAVVDAQARAILAASSILGETARRAAPCFDAPQCDARGVSSADVERAIKLASSAYTAQVESAVRALYGSAVDSDRLVQRGTRGGWAAAGTTMYTMAQVQTQIAQLQTWTPAVVPPTERDAAVIGVIGDGGIYSMSWDADVATQAAGTATSTGRALAKWIAQKLTVDPADKRHALLQLKDSGDQIMVWSQAIIAASGLLEAGAGLARKGAAVVVNPVAGLFAGAAGEAAGAAKYGAMVLLGTGVVMSLVLPLLPFVFWIGSVIGWVIAAIEGVVAAPIWLAAHLHPEGDDLTGKGGAGYMMILEIVARPIFMVLGLVAAFVLSDAALRLLGLLFWGSVDQVQSDSVTGVASAVVLVIMYVGMVWTITRMCFGLIHDLPSTIMRWVGGAHASHDKGAEFGSAAQGQVTTGWAKAEPQLQRTLGNVGGAARGAIGGLAGRPSSSASPKTTNHISPAD